MVGIIASYLLAAAGDFANIGMGLYGIGIAAVGMLSIISGKDFKSGQTLMKTVLAPMFKTRMLG